MNIIDGIFELVLLFFLFILGLFLIFLFLELFIPDPTDNFIEWLIENIMGEMCDGDKKRVKNGTAVYITCDTFMILHDSNPDEYPLYPDNPDKTFEKAGSLHSVAFTPKEGHKLKKILREMEKEEEKKKAVVEEEKEKNKLNKDRLKTIKDVEKMVKEIKRYSDKQEQELSNLIEKHKSILTELEGTKK